MHFLRALLSVLTVSSACGHAKALGQNKGLLVDLCANVNGEVKRLDIDTKLDLCLCISAIPALISTHIQLKSAARRQGTSTVIDAVTDLVRFQN